METIVIKVLAIVAGLIVSSVTRVQLPALGPTPVLGVVALGVVLALILAVACAAWCIARDLRPVTT